MAFRTYQLDLHESHDQDSSPSLLERPGSDNAFVPSGDTDVTDYKVYLFMMLPCPQKILRDRALCPKVPLVRLI